MNSPYELDYASVLSPQLAPRLLPALKRHEGRKSVLLATLMAIAFGAAYFWFLFQYWAPAHPGVDQNGYLVGGRLLSQTGSTGFIPDHALGFVSAMWVRVPETGMNYPKYPIGLPMLYAIFFWVFGPDTAPKWAHLVSPVSMSLAMVGTYCLARQFTGAFASWCAMLLLAFSQVTLTLANNPNSHASCLACVVWGMYLLLRFWQTGSVWRGLLAGFLLGYAVTIRYTEGLLVVPIGVVMLTMLRWRDWRNYARVATPLIGWLVPVAYLVLFNWFAMGTISGYDTTNESKPGSAFTWEHVTMNWEKLIRQVHDTGLFFVVPLGLLGMAMAWRESSRRASILWLWLLPGTIVYMAYYWAPDRGVSYLRFFLTLMPPLAVGAAVVFDEFLQQSYTRFRAMITPVACGCVLALACGLGLYRAIFGLEDGTESPLGLESQARINTNLALLGDAVKGSVATRSVVFGTQNDLNHIQFVGDYHLFNTEYFTQPFVNRLRQAEQTTDAENDPVTQQAERRRWLLGILDGKSDQELIDLQNQIMDRALARGTRVYMVLNKATADNILRRYVRRKPEYQTKVVATSSDYPRITPVIEDNTEPRRPRARVPARQTVPQVYQVIEVTRSR